MGGLTVPVITLGDWTLWTITKDGEPIKLHITNKEPDDNILLFLDVKTNRDGKVIYYNISVVVEKQNFDDLGYYREFIEKLQEASDFAQEVYKYAVENGFWDL